jgi:hypothetical protein
VGVLLLFHAARAYRPEARIVSRDLPRVVVDAKEVELLLRQRKIICREIGPRLAEDIFQFLGIRAEQCGIEILAIHVRLGSLHRGQVSGILRSRILGLDVHDESNRTAQVQSAIHLNSGTMRTHEVMTCKRRLERAAMPRCKHTVQVTTIGHDPWFIQRHPIAHTVAELAKHDFRVLCEPVGDVAIEPTPSIIERRRQVPVIQRRHRLNPFCEQPIDETIVKSKARGIHAARSFGQHPTPCNAEPIRLHAELTHQSHIAFVTPIVVAGDITSVAVGHAVRCVREAMPNARAGAVRKRRALDLIRGGRASPKKILRESASVVRHVSLGDASTNEVAKSSRFEFQQNSSASIVRTAWLR